MKILSLNKGVLKNWQILEKFSAGIVLLGQEVKSIKTKRINLSGSYVIIKNLEAFWTGAKIPPYQEKNAPADYRPKRDRKLLLKKKELSYLYGKVKRKGVALIPLKLYLKNAKIKLEFALCKKKKGYQRKEELKKRDLEREIKRELKWG